MRKIALLLVLGLFLASASLAMADTVTLTLVTVGPGAAGGPNVGGGEYVYPYYTSVNGSSLIPMICDDYSHTVYLGESWTARVSNYSDLSGTMFNAVTDSVLRYEAAAWLVDQLGQKPTQDKAVAINYAIWSLFSNDPTLAKYAGNWVQQAMAAVPNLDQSYFSQFAIYTPTAAPQGYGMPQELIARVPEPGTLALLGCGLLGLVGFYRKKA